LALGFSTREVARGLGISGPSVLLLVAELRDDLERLS
jgi:DNA-binding CsgD family transcriptional regulator